MRNESPSVHGVLVSVFGKGVLLTGESGIGKSDLALQLLARKHALIADDIVLIRQGTEGLTGFAPAALKNLLEVRALGIIDVRAVFGMDAVLATQSLDLIIHLQKTASKELLQKRRINFELGAQIILETSLPRLVLELALCQNAAILIETAVRLTFSAHVIPDELSHQKLCV